MGTQCFRIRCGKFLLRRVGLLSECEDEDEVPFMMSMVRVGYTRSMKFWWSATRKSRLTLDSNTHSTGCKPDVIFRQIGPLKFHDLLMISNMISVVLSSQENARNQNHFYKSFEDSSLYPNNGYHAQGRMGTIDRSVDTTYSWEDGYYAGCEEYREDWSEFI